MPGKLILRCSLSPGDIVLLTGAVRDLHRSCSGRFITDVRTSCPDLWTHNPYLTRLSEQDPEVRILECECPLIEESNRAPYHALHGYTDFLARRLRVPVRPLLFHGDIHLSGTEKEWFSQVHEIVGQDIPFWIVSAGGKYDCTVKWWSVPRFQAVIDHFRGRIQFVQVGAVGHHHPPLRGVIDLRGQTSLRELVRLVYHADGVLCGITCLMHLAAAVETRPDRPRQRPCVVVAGGREPPHWEAYPHHRYLHTVGALPCCAAGGCWRSRTRPFHDGADFDRPHNLCVDVAGDLPRCMDMIRAKDVIRAIEQYGTGGAFRYLAPAFARAGMKAARLHHQSGFDDLLTVSNARARLEETVRNLEPFPGRYGGRGAVICGGGIRYWPPAWVCLNQLRRLGWRLPIQFWHLGPDELHPEMRRLLTRLGVDCVDAEEVRQKHPIRILRGWELKAFAITHCPFREVLLLDSDNVPVRNPEYLFETPEYRRTGAIFWPDVRFYRRKDDIWRLTGVEFRPGPEFETGQIVLNKERCWKALRLALWINEHSDFFYRYVLGDKETFYFAFRKLRQPYAMPSTRVRRLPWTMCQHDFQGRRVFQHRNGDKWNVWLRNPKIPGFQHDAACREFLRQLRHEWDGGMGRFTTAGPHPLPSLMPLAGATAPRILALIFSTPECKVVSSRTLARLRRSGWPHGDARIVSVSSRDKRSLWQAARRALRVVNGRKPDYLLLLGENLRFNSSFWRNLLCWGPLTRKDSILASLCYPGVRADACDIENFGFLAKPDAEHQSHAFLISRTILGRLLRCWTADDQEPGPPLLARVAARLQLPVLYHSPSLVENLTSHDGFLGESNAAADYHPSWRRRLPASQLQDWSRIARNRTGA